MRLWSCRCVRLDAQASTPGLTCMPPLHQVLIAQPFFRHIAMPAVKNMHWFEFFALTGCPMLWGSTMAIFFLTEVTNTGLVDGFAMAISSITAGMVVQVVSNWLNMVLFYGHSLDLFAVAAVCGVYLAHVSLVVLLLNCQRRIPLTFFARKTGGAEDEEARTTFVPIKGVASGIMPILVADMFTGGLSVNSNYFTVVIYIGIILSMCLVDFNNVPLELAEMLTKMGTRVQGVRPGTATVMYLQEQQQSVRLFGGLCFVGLVFVSLGFNQFLGAYGQFFSFTSNIILVRCRIAPADRQACKPEASLLHRWLPSTRAIKTSAGCASWA